MPIASKISWLTIRLEQEVDDRHFFMGRWLGQASDDPFDSSPVIYEGEWSIPHCQTAGCLAGTVFLGLTPEERLSYRHGRGLWRGFGNIARRAGQTVLGLTDDETSELFEPCVRFATGLCTDDRGEPAFASITREEAIRCLKTMLRYKVIDWTYATKGRLISDHPARPVKFD